MMRELEEEERNSLLNGYQQLIQRLREYCMSKPNYPQFLESEFGKEDTIRAGTMDYTIF